MRRLVLAGLILLSGCYDSSDYITATPDPAGPWPRTRSGPWEQFVASEIDLEGHSIFFAPGDGEEVTYEWTAEEGAGRFVEPGTGPFSLALELPDDGFAVHPFRRIDAVELFGVRYDRMFVSSNGHVTFDEGSGSLSDWPEEHFLLPGVAVLRGDLDPRFAGEVIVDEWDDLVAVSWVGVPGYGETTGNTVQIVLRSSGAVELHYELVSSGRSFLVGLSNGLAGETPAESDFVPGPVAGPERCDDGLDNDRDWLVDCDDPDCAAECAPARELDCFNGLDDDSDGAVDCDDSDCRWEIRCYEELVCDDGHDDEGDGFTDCDDVECWDDPACAIPNCVGAWESFAGGEAEDLAGAAIYFEPTGGAVAWGADPFGGTYSDEPGSGDETAVLALSDDESAEHRLAVTPEIRFFGRSYDRLFVSSNGYVTFGRGSTSFGYAPQNLFELPCVAALRGDLDPSRGGTIVVDEYPDRVVVTWDAVPWYSGDRTNSAQLVIRTGGEAAVFLPEIATGRGRYLVGVGNGCNREAWPDESDFIDAE